MKRTIIDTETKIESHLKSGHVFPIDGRLERVDGNIYLDRVWHGHPTIASTRSILMPKHHLWVMFWQGHDGPHQLQSYIHMARTLDEGRLITVEDLYLDVLVWQDGRWQVVDIDEFRAAIAEGELSPEQIQAALLGLEHACALVDGAHGQIEAHLKATLLKRN